MGIFITLIAMYAFITLVALPFQYRYIIALEEIKSRTKGFHKIKYMTTCMQASWSYTTTPRETSFFCRPT
jgi:hypothetical protein